MKIQNLAVIFIIIVLPISMVITAYVQNQIETLELQVSYDFKLKQATADALKAFQLNTVNSSTSDLANSKIRDIEASVNSFYNSMANQFNMVGYNQDILKDYVPAIVYTMYDGYYIYTPFTNKLDPEDDLNSEDYTDVEGEIKQHYYYEGQNLYSLKPYVHYSCRYVNGSDNDIVITYTLDNCITVEGTVNGKGVYKTGYLLDNTNGNLTKDADGNITGTMTYRGVTINAEDLTEKVMAYGDLDGNKDTLEMNGKIRSSEIILMIKNMELNIIVIIMVVMIYGFLFLLMDYMYKQEEIIQKQEIHQG